MSLDLVRLVTEATDEDIAKSILSSGDFFPGFYRFTLGTRDPEFGQLTSTNLVEAFMQQETVGTKHNRDKWTEYSKKRLNDQIKRSAERANAEVHEWLVDRYSDWSQTASAYDIAIVETDESVDKIETDTTYFFMGSMIRFVGPRTMLVGYDLLRDEHIMSLDVDVNAIIEYVNKVYANDMRHLFLRADVVASLSFDDSDVGTLTMNESSMARALMVFSENVIYASNRDRSSHLPIRWAKDIFLTDVTMDA